MQLVMLFGERKITRITDNSRAITLHLTIATGKLVKKTKAFRKGPRICDCTDEWLRARAIGSSTVPQNQTSWNTEMWLDNRVSAVQSNFHIVPLTFSWQNDTADSTCGTGWICLPACLDVVCLCNQHTIVYRFLRILICFAQNFNKRQHLFLPLK